MIKMVLSFILRGENPDLPPARFRQAFVFQKNMECNYTSLSSSDRHALVNGTYLIKKDLLIIKNLAGDDLFKYRIDSTTSNEIWLEKLLLE